MTTIFYRIFLYHATVSGDYSHIIYIFREILYCNPVKEGRTPLCLLTSRDGLNFEKDLTLEDTPGKYSYPAVIWDGEKIRGTYTWKREKIVYFEAEF